MRATTPGLAEKFLISIELSILVSPEKALIRRIDKNSNAVDRTKSVRVALVRVQRVSH